MEHVINVPHWRVKPPVAPGGEKPMLSFWYEQSPVLASGDIAGDVYRAESGFVRDWQWHRLNPQSHAMYRVIPDYLQVVILDREGVLESADPTAEMSEVLSAIERAGPFTLYENDQPEIFIRPVEGGGYEMTSRWIFLETGVAFIDFTPEQWNDAYARLGELESKQE